MKLTEYLSCFTPGVYTLCKKDAAKCFSQRHIYVGKTADVTAHQGERDVYVSMNPFVSNGGRFRCAENVALLNMVYVDIDVAHSKALSSAETARLKDSVIFTLEKEYFGKRFPTPSFIIDSGRGLYLQWLLAGESTDSLALWKSVTARLVELLKNFGADGACKDTARVMRLPGTVNSNSNTVVKIVGGNGDPVKLSDFDEQYYFFSEPTPSKPKRKKATRGVFKAENAPVVADGITLADTNLKVKNVRRSERRFLNEQRILDLYRIADYQKWDADGGCKKEVLLFLLRYFALSAGYSPSDALSLTLRFNERFKKPHTERYVETHTASAQKAWESDGKVMYNYTNESLIELLDLKAVEAELCLKTIMSAAEAKRRRSEQNRRAYAVRRNGASKAESVRRRRLNLASMLLKGKTLASACRSLKISRSTFFEDKKATQKLVEAVLKKRSEKASPKNSAPILLYNLFLSESYGSALSFHLEPCDGSLLSPREQSVLLGTSASVPDVYHLLLEDLDLSLRFSQLA